MLLQYFVKNNARMKTNSCTLEKKKQTFISDVYATSIRFRRNQVYVVFSNDLIKFVSFFVYFWCCLMEK